MLTTFLLALVLVGAVAITLIAWAALFGLGLRWAKARQWTWRRLAVISVVVNVVAIAYQIGVVWVFAHRPQQELAVVLLATVGYLLLNIGIISWSFRISALRAIQAWLPTLLSGLPVVLFSFLVVRPLLFEPYVIPTNSMMPTLLGWHGRDVCATCGGTCYFTPPPEDVRYSVPLPMTCDQFHVTEKQPQSLKTYLPTRIVAARFLRPRRWDLMVFESPADPQ